ncbi:MAG: hypothetical protein AB7G21_05295 [Dehalococcoidia bacterium]
MSRDELRTRQVEAVLGYLARYASAGHRLRFERRHGASGDDNEIVFSVADWPAFIGVMEPGHPLARDVDAVDLGPRRRD